jgi:signal transduction histidine kinase
VRAANTGAGALALALGLSLVYRHPVVLHAPTLRATLETASALCALSGAWLFARAFAYARCLDDLLVSVGLLWVAALQITAGVLPTAMGLQAARFPAAVLSLGAVVTALTFLFAGRAAPGETVERITPLSGRASARAAVVLAWTLLGAWLLRDEIASTRMAGSTGAGSAHPHLAGVVLAVVACTLLTLAAIKTARKFEHGDRIALLTLVTGFSVLAAAQLQYALTQPLFSQWVGVSDFLRLLGYVLIVAAGLRKEAISRKKISAAVALRERRRIARDLHDGLAQDLAFIAAHGERIAREEGEVAPLVIAARRALAVSRGAIVDLSASEEATAKEAIERVAEELGRRFRVNVAVDIAGDIALIGAARENVVRIVREAIVNAARGDAGRITISLTHSAEGFTLRIQDDGGGIEISQPVHWGFGMRSMHERAVALGGSLSVRGNGGGTELEVVFP